jgi:hypothetical protein
MLTRLKRFLSQFFRKSRTINNQPLNKVSLIVLIVIDLFILFNVFTGLGNISHWHLSPSEAYPCVSEWQGYREQKGQKDRDYGVVQSSLVQDVIIQDPKILNSSFKERYQNFEQNHLGRVSPICLTYAELKDKVNSSENKKLYESIHQKQTKISNLEQANSSIRSQYDSTLLEKIAGQGSKQSINTVRAEKARQTIAHNKSAISKLENETAALKGNLVKKPESLRLLDWVKSGSKYKTIQQGYQHASFWYPSIQLAFQALFLLPLIATALFVHRLALHRGAGLIALISWHLLAILSIPLLLKIFEFLQIGAVFKFIVDIVSTLFGGLVFLVSYLYILIIPLVGFGMIKLSQKLAFNKKNQASSRFQRRLCFNCAKKIRAQDRYCPHCGYGQYLECQNCHELTYKHLSHCKQCGCLQDLQDSGQILSSELPTDSTSSG